MTDEARRLRALAAEARLAARAKQLRRLADDLDAGNDLERWAEIDLYAAFLREDTVADADRPAAPPGRWASVLEVAPSVLIFLPIVVTWFGLYNATLAYRESRGDPALANKSFLEQWQSGFGGRLGDWLYFDRIALWTLAGVGVLVLASVAREIVRRRAEERAERARAADAREAADLMRELAAALTDADFVLSRLRMNPASRAEAASQQLSDVADRAGEAARAAAEMLAESRAAVNRAKEVLDRVEALAAAMLSGETAVREAAGTVGAAADGVGVRLAEIEAATVRLNDGVAAMTASVSADSARLSASAEQILTAAAQEMRSTVEANGRELGDTVARALDTAGAAIRRALDEFGQATGGVEARLAELSAATALVGEGAAGLSRTAAQDSEKLRESAERILTDAAEHLRATVADSERELATSVAAALDTAGTKIGDALDEWRTEGAIYAHRHEAVSDLLSQVVREVNEQVGGMRESVDGLPKAIERLGEHSEEAARRMDGQTDHAAERMEAGISTASARLTAGLDGAAAQMATRLDAATAQMTGSLDGAADRLRGRLDDFLAGLPRDTSQARQVAAELAWLRQAMDQLRAQLSWQVPAPSSYAPPRRRRSLAPWRWFR